MYLSNKVVKILNLAMQSLWQMQPLLASSAEWECKGWLLLLSTAIQRTTGEDCSSEVSPDELGCSLAEWALRVKAVKLEKEVQDLTMRYKRAVADCENIRRCVEDSKIFRIQSFCKILVEVFHILEKTTECISEESEPVDQKLTLEEVFQGLSLFTTLSDKVAKS
ncbi:grpE protein homolog 2, mitochondrial-like [Hylobates moloch]|uniref:grpE protein homolog 2, mitochondrial-like n=1 Tax=Hylobates moloch TaxID=81572 RepID=UPI0013F18E0C|nr:grpE protein homolog 2, mitochondrial-like [Hylobates moloch]